MNMPVNRSALLQRIASENLRACRQILAGDQQTAEQLALSCWWDNLPRTTRAALLTMAGVPPEKRIASRKWQKLPEPQRAAVILTARAFAESVGGILATLTDLRAKALQSLQAEARRIADAARVAA